ncbi:hypothetical protein [Candidatus Endoriftia persephonae]|jgi:hypothetical protein|uniref:Uncharacterized protein n=1 Tax=Candidatus Endoriftia persephonae TaxID=393765 RepID=A0A9J6ZYN3_9GAMM|nr:hypothetical protein [Candidatus Endoriftia persephone]USF87868.1 hypothetical protein L0Y14_01055 [Candidatus Endoriftia persephone]
MKTVFDMSTGQVVERYSAKDECSEHRTTANELIAPSAAQPQLGLQEVIAEQHEEKRIPPELVLADLNAFLDEMS